jgi:tRNA/tmRNA/rRNA uracil-C5-methylase (TrmA/RlmC/RlmD family)
VTSTVYIAKNVYGGDGMGRLGDGRVVFVKGAWAGEQVKAKMVQEKKNFVKADLVEVVESSPQRIEGAPERLMPGCVYATLSYQAECEVKESQLREMLERARLIDADFPIKTFGANKQVRPLNYRNKAVYHFEKADNSWVIGYRREPQHDIIDIKEDPLAVKEINAKLPEIRKSVLQLLTTGPHSVRRDIQRCGNVTVRWSEKTGVKWWVGQPPKDLVFREVTNSLTFEVPAGGFYQMNPQVGALLVDYVVKEYSKDPRDLIDLYCGVGVFGLSCFSKTKSPFIRSLIGVESGHEAIDFAKKNAMALGVKAEFTAGQVIRNLNKITINETTTVIVDPPRGGMERGVPEFLERSKAAKIIYVSCDPATLVRDLKVLSKSYRIDDIAWFNMFSRTARFETVITLLKK